MQSDQSQGDSTAKSNTYEERGGSRVPTGQHTMEFTGGNEEVNNNTSISELMRAGSSEKGSQSSLRSAGKSGGMEIAPPMFITERKKLTTETNPTPFMGKGGVGQGSSYRKRSRVSAEDKTGKQKGQSSFGQPTKVEEYVRQLQSVFDHIVTNGEKTLAVKYTAVEALKNINLEYAACLATINNLSNKLLNAQDERNALQQQVVELQAQLLQRNSAGFNNDSLTSNSYLTAAMRGAASGIHEGKRLPLPSIPVNLKHAPAEKIIIFRAKEKGEPVGKIEHENFRNNLKSVLGPVYMQSIEVIRPTRHGGHTVIFSSEGERDMAMAKLRYQEEEKGVQQTESCMIAPKKQKAKAICRLPPEDATPDEFLREVYSRTNPQLCSVATNKREMQIVQSKALGWILELSSEEAAAINAQGGRVRYGGGREVRMEEFILIQQCYRCCVFGHNAMDCTTQVELCRLCAAMDHSGKDCPYKEEKEKWKCINCAILNAQKGYNLPTAHAAAQLHKCPCAQHQKVMKKAQLAAAGVFVTPVFGESEIQQLERQTNSKKEQQGHGVQRETLTQKAKTKSKSRSKSKSKRNFSSSSSSSSSSASSSNKVNNKQRERHTGPIEGTQFPTSAGAQINLSQISRPVRISRPTSADGWKVARRFSSGSKNEDGRGRDMECRHANINSTDVTGLKDTAEMMIETQES